MKSKINFNSKTIWGFGIALTIVFLQQYQIIPENFISDLVQTIASITGVIGARDALR